jgi:DNA-binding transcriptional LysR family regulator
MHDVDTQLLRTFVSLAETHSFSRTAGRVGRSQSAVSGQLAKLETALGVRLFVRDTRNVALTPEGERLLPDARAMVSQADAMLARFRAPDLAGLVRFGSPEDFASFYLPDILGVFAAAHPAVELHVTCQLTLPLIAEFEAGEHDLIVIKQDPARLHPGARTLWRERLVWATAPQFNIARRPVPLVLSPAPCVYRARALGALQAAGWDWIGVYTSPSFAGAIAAVRAGLGATVMPEAMVPPGLVVQDGWPALAEAEIALLAPQRPSPAVAALASFVMDKVRR